MILVQLLAGGLFVLLASYLAGSLPFGFIIGKLNGIDIRTHGSKNIGATNVLRVLGRDWGIICFLLDFLKGALPVIFIGQHLGQQLVIGPVWGELIAGCGAVLGHLFPLWLNFKGGKGVATSLGVVLALAFWSVIVAAIVWLILFYSTRIVSLASMGAGICMALSSLIMNLCGWGKATWPECILLIVLAALIIWRHKENLKRLRNGTELAFRK
jgi:glycerol-3-phosphate acyltransferase PlsY